MSVSISSLTELTTPAAADVIAVDDIDAATTKKLTIENLFGNAGAINASFAQITQSANRHTINTIADVNNQGFRLGDSTTSRLTNLSQNTSGDFVLQHFDGVSAWANHLKVDTNGQLTATGNVYATKSHAAGTVVLAQNTNTSGYAQVNCNGSGGSIVLQHGNAGGLLYEAGGNTLSVYNAGVNTLRLGANGHDDDLIIQTSHDVDVQNNLIVGGNVDIGDNQYFRVGFGNDGQFFHDGSNTYVRENGTGDLYLEGTNVAVRTGGAKRFETFASGNNAAVGNFAIGKGAGVEPSVRLDIKQSADTSALRLTRSGTANRWDIYQTSTGLLYFQYDGVSAAYIGTDGSINSPGDIDITGGFQAGSPTGGNKGAGTINAVGVYDDNTLLTHYVFEAALDGDVTESLWDSFVPHKRYKTPFGHVLENNKHEPMRKFKARLGSDYDPLNIDAYAKHWREKRHLTSMPSKEKYDKYIGLSGGEWIQRLIETVEIQAVHIETLNQRVKVLEVN